MYRGKVFLSENNDLPSCLQLTPFSVGSWNPYSSSGWEVLLMGKRGFYNGKWSRDEEEERVYIGFFLACALKWLRERSCVQVESYPKFRYTILRTSLKINVRTRSFTALFFHLDQSCPIKLSAMMEMFSIWAALSNNVAASHTWHWKARNAACGTQRWISE